MKILFYIAKKYSIPIVEPLVQYLEETGNDHALFVSQKVFRELPESWQSKPIFRNVQETIPYAPDYVIVPGNFVDFRLPGKKVQVFHGLGVEKASHYKIRHFFDLYCTSGPFVTERFEKLQKRYKYFLVRETGWPKVDYILNYPSKNIRKELNIPKSKKVILYAPTFSAKMQSATDLMSVIPSIIREDEIWFVKFHELMKSELIVQFVNNVSDSVRLIEDYDITPYLHVSDVLISDTSSVVYEFMVLDKPVVTCRTQSRFDKGIDIQHPNELRDSIDQCLKNPQQFKENRKKHLNEVNPRLDGNISQHLFDILTNLKPEDWPKYRKPLNGFRRLQVLYHEKFRKGYLR